MAICWAFLEGVFVEPGKAAQMLSESAIVNDMAPWMGWSI